jgi:beta-galactosidase
MANLTRRRFLQTAAVATTAASIAPHLHAEPDPRIPYPENGTLIPDEGWHLWVDQHAPWQDDDLFLPEDIAWLDNKLCAKGQPLPTNAPTGGWQALTPKTGLEVILPTTVEQHFWGKFGSRPYTAEEYRYAVPEKGPAPPADDDVPQNGAYFGVSWFYRAIDIPAALRGKRIFLHIRGAHLRAEVYLNGQLCGYSIMEELPFEADLTQAANPGGENLLAIRITNPFGRFDWVDGLNAKWGHLSLYRSHGFGGIDRGLTISAHLNSRITDVWVLNTQDPTQIEIRAKVFGGKQDRPASIECKIIDPDAIHPSHARKDWESKAFEGSIDFEQLGKGPSNRDGGISEGYILKCTISAPGAQLWDLKNPKLYHLQVKTGNGDYGDTRTIAFGFRSFAPAGIGTDAMFRLNGRRIRLYSSISWGFWGLNGMFPVPELAEKEVVAAKTLGLNCLNFHRNLAKEDVLRKHDELGLLRYMEPGAGKLAIGKLPPKTASNAAGTVMDAPRTEAEKFAQRYMFVRCVEMVKAYRSHPSVIEYCLQNELGADLKNPATLAILKAMHDEDPSRMVVLNDGFVARGAAQAWYEPWSADLTQGKLHRSDESPWGDWWMNHQGAGDQWYDEFYKSPADYTYKAPFKQYLTEYGEMEGCARPDVHGLDIHQITETYKRYGGTSYDLADHQQIQAAYDAFLDKWGFRKAFPTPDHVYRAVGKTCYESWQNYMENARISDELDFAVISGWESTAMENHSGIVDNLRNFKADPKLIAGSLLPIRPIAKQRSLVVSLGPQLDAHAIFDLYLANDTGKSATGTLEFSMITPIGEKIFLKSFPSPSQTPDTFSYLLEEGFNTPPLRQEGLYRFQFSISSVPGATQTKEIWVSCIVQTDYVKYVDGSVGYWLNCEKAYQRLAVSGVSASLRKQLVEVGQYTCHTIHDFIPGEKYDLIISGGLTAHTAADQYIGETTGESLPAAKPGRKLEPGETAPITELGHLDPAILEAVKAGTPLLAIPQADTLSEGVAKQLAVAGAFTYHGTVGDLRAPWMGNWYFGRQHPIFDGMPTDAALGSFYQVKGRQSNGLLVDGPNVEIVVAYSRDHDRRIGAGTFTTKLGAGKVLYHRTPDFHPVLQQRFLANALRWLTT